MSRTAVAMLTVMHVALSFGAEGFLEHGARRFPLYPSVTTECPDLPSPLTDEDGREFVVVRLAAGTFGLVNVSLENRPGELEIDAEDFPSLAETGLHDPEHLAEVDAITGRSVEEITALARPGGLSQDGFMAADEDIVSVLAHDDAIVRRMGLTHADLARPLMHVWNLMQRDPVAHLHR